MGVIRMPTQVVSTEKLGSDCKFCGRRVVIGDWGEVGSGFGDCMDDERADVAHFECEVVPCG